MTNIMIVANAAVALADFGYRAPYHSWCAQY